MTMDPKDRNILHGWPVLTMGLYWKLGVKIKSYAVFTKSAGLLVKTSEISFWLTKYFILSDNSPTKIIIITMITYRSAKIGFCPATKCSLPDSCHAANKKISRRLAICINLNLNPRLLYLESNTTFYHFATMLPEIQKTFILKANDF